MLTKNRVFPPIFFRKHFQFHCCSLRPNRRTCFIKNHCRRHLFMNFFWFQAVRFIFWCFFPPKKTIGNKIHQIFFALSEYFVCFAIHCECPTMICAILLQILKVFESSEGSIVHGVTIGTSASQIQFWQNFKNSSGPLYPSSYSGRGMGTEIYLFIMLQYLFKNELWGTYSGTCSDPAKKKEEPVIVALPRASALGYGECVHFQLLS